MNLEKLKTLAITGLVVAVAVAWTYAAMKPPVVEIREIETEVPTIIEKIVPEYIEVEKVKYISRDKIREVYVDRLDEMPALPEEANKKVISVKEFNVPQPATIIATAVLDVETGEGNILVKQRPLDIKDSDIRTNLRENIKSGILGDFGYLDGTEIYLDYSTQGKVYGLRQNLAKFSHVRADAYLEGGQYAFPDPESGADIDRNDVVLGVQVSVRVDKLGKMFRRK